MNTTATQPLTTLELVTENLETTNTPLFSDLLSLDTSTIPTFAELLAEYQATIDQPEVAWNVLSSDPSADSAATDQPTRWLWPQRLSLAGINLLDADHGCGKSLLAFQIAASISSGSPMPDGSPSIQGGVVII